MKFEVVCTESYLDVGLLVETEVSKPKKILSRNSTYASGNEYGGIRTVKWVHTGVFLSEEEWNKTTLDKPTSQILHELNIKISKERECMVTMKKEKQYFECVFIDGTKEDFEKLCTEVDDNWNNYKDMVAFKAINHETGEYIVLQIISKSQIRQIINHYTKEDIEKVFC